MHTRGWMLDVVVTALAILSLATWGFYLWIDLRFAGTFLAAAMPAVWGVSALATPLLLRSPRHAAMARAALWPTYLVLLVAVANAVVYYRLWSQDNIDATIPLAEVIPQAGIIPPLPMCLWIGVILLFWARSVRRRAGAVLAGDVPPAPTRRRRLFGAGWILVAGGAVAGFFALHMAAQPPAEPVDLAVVFGNRVREDGTAAVILEERVLAAVDLYRRGLARRILCSGTPPETLAMQKVCIEQKVRADDILLDPLGVNTKATVANTKELLARRRWSSVAACSSASHLPRIRLTYSQAGMRVASVESVRTLWQQADLRETLREAVGLAVYGVSSRYRSAKAGAMNVQEPRLVVIKSARRLELYDGSRLVKTYPCITGSHVGDKEWEGDRKTPVGNFRIVFMNPDSKFHLSMGLDYPTAKDAARGLAAGRITQAEHDRIVAALSSDLTQESVQKTYWYTALGGEIFIHGHAEGRSGTAGCVAVSNPDIEELYGVCRVGTPVEIRE